MSVSGKTTHRSLPYLETSNPPVFHEAGKLLAERLDNDIEGGQGALAARPAAGLRGRVYVVQGDPTESNNGIVWWDTGSTWLPVNSLRTLAGTQLRVAYGVATMEWSGGVGFATVAHGLDAMPVFASATALSDENGSSASTLFFGGDGSPYGIQMLGVGNMTATEIEFAAAGGFTAAGTTKIKWIAFG